jgi:hypothetical protein
MADRDQRTNDDGTGKVVAAFDDAGQARDAARNAVSGRAEATVSRGRSAELASDEEEVRTHWVSSGVQGAVAGGLAGALLGVGIGFLLVATTTMTSGLAFGVSIAVAAFAGAWAGAIVRAFRRNWQLSQRDMAGEGDALLTVEAPSRDEADAAFAAAQSEGATRVEEFDGAGERLHTGSSGETADRNT